MCPDGTDRRNQRYSENKAWVIFKGGPFKGKYQVLEYKKNSEIRIKIKDTEITYWYGANSFHHDEKKLTEVTYNGIS